MTADVAPAAEPASVRNVLLGIALGTLLHQRGRTVLHSSVAGIEDEAVAFLGHKGAGKSTTAAALLARGHDLLSDDILAVDFQDDTPNAIPGFPLFKFDPDSFDDSNLPASPAPDPETGYDKLYYELDGEFDWQPRELSTITILEPERDGPTQETLTGHDALMAVLEHAWPVRLQQAPYVEIPEAIEDPDLDRYARLVEHCHVQRLSLDHDHETLDELGRELEQYL